MAKPQLHSNVVSIDSESTRPLATQAFAPSSVMTFKLPEDTCVRALQIRLSGSIVTTFASGTPVADNFGPMDDLISTVSIRVGGSTAIKTVTPRMLSFHQYLAYGQPHVERASAGAAAATDGTVTADVNAFPYGTTGQITSVSESLTVFFECPLVKVGQQKTWLNLRGVTGNELVLNTRSYSNLLAIGNTAPVVYSSSTLNIDVMLVEARTIEQNRMFSIYKETYQIEPFSAAASSRVIQLNKGQKIIGISMLARDGGAATTTGATQNLATNRLVSSLKLTLNGTYTVKNSTWNQLCDDNKNRFALSAAYASNFSPLEGFAYWDLCQFGNIDTALDARFLDNVQLEVVTNTATATMVYTNVATLLTHQHELVG